MKSVRWVGCILAASCFTGVAARDIGSKPVVPADPDAAGKELVARLLALQPAGGMTNSAALTNYVRRKVRSTAALRIEVTVTESNWTTSYIQPGPSKGETRFTVVRHLNGRNAYHVESNTNGTPTRTAFQGQEAGVSIAGSDFTLADVGMEFLHWPTQRVLAKEVSRTQSCDKLESLAPPGWTNGYTRVLSWFDIDTGGPVLVQAYNAAGSMVKEFKPNGLRKVEGQWQVEEVEISNPRTDTRSMIHFDFQSR